MKSPYFDNRFYWLSGELYTWIGGLSAQLRSIQWRHTKPGEVRHLCRRDFRPFSSARHYGRVEVTWAMSLTKALDEANAEIRRLAEELGRSSEEGRVGTEGVRTCRSRWATINETKNRNKKKT